LEHFPLFQDCTTKFTDSVFRDGETRVWLRDGNYSRMTSRLSRTEIMQPRADAESQVTVMLNLNEARDLARDFMASVVITDYSRAIYDENSLIDGEKE